MPGWQDMMAAGLQTISRLDYYEDEYPFLMLEPASSRGILRWMKHLKLVCFDWGPSLVERFLRLDWGVSTCALESLSLEDLGDEKYDVEQRSRTLCGNSMFFRSGILASLRSLQLDWVLTPFPEGAALLANATQLTGLTTLSLKGIEWSVANTQRVLEASPFSSLTRLAIDIDVEDPNQALDLAKTLKRAHLSRLESLAITGRDGLLGEGLGEQAVRFLLRATTLTALTSLNFAGNQLSETFLNDLGQATGLRQLRALNLSISDFPIICRENASSPFRHLSQLTCLELNDVAAGPRFFQGSWLPAGVKRLGVSGLDSGAGLVDGLAALCAGRQLTHLNLSRCTDPSSAESFFSRRWEGLEWLDVTGNGWGNASLRFLDHASFAPSLRYVRLRGNAVEPAVRDMLLAATSSPVTFTV